MTTDGRVARRQRNQDLVLDAVLDMFDRGRFEPAVDEVSALSTVSTRSIYRYYKHREGLIEAALWHLLDRQEAQDPIKIDVGPVDGRIEAFVEHRIRTWSRIAPVVRAVQRLARPLDPAHEHAGPEHAGLEHAGTRPVFVAPPSVVFEADFSTVAPRTRRLVEVAADMAFEFASLDFLAGALESDTAAMSSVLVNHLRQQLTTA